MNMLLLSLLALLTSQNLYADPAQDRKVIYGADNRHDPYSYQNPEIVELTKSTVALVKSYKLTASNGGFELSTKLFGDERNYCPDERFLKHPVSAFCSGFLIAPNKVMTAGHCVKTNSDCDSLKLVFDFKMKDATTYSTHFNNDQVFSCKKILGHTLDSSGVDFAIIELDREVPGRAPLKLADNSNLSVGDELFLIGHPSGMAMKITDSANVRSINTSSGFLVANTDTYGGNSGSAVFNARTMEVEGILVRGEKDFDSSSGCVRSYQVSDTEGRGEDITLVSRASENGGIQEPTGELRYVWLDSDQTCNQFRGDSYIGEVANSFCGRTDSPSTPTTPTTPVGVRYVWLDSDNTCNEFHGDSYIREVSDSLCGRGSSPSTPSTPAGVRYVWLDSDMSCNEFHGDSYIREVDNSLCGRSSNAGVRYVWLDSDNTCNEFQGDSYIREVDNSLCGRSANAGVRYVWLDSDMTCNEFQGDSYIREVPNYNCGR